MLRPLLAASSLLVSSLVAQVPTDPVVLQDRLEQKLASPFLVKAPWHTGLDSARREAARTGKLIFAHFTRSFVPCGTSIRCEREILARGDFVKFARDVVLFCHVTARVDAAADQLLFTTGGSGWPHHVLMDATGRVVARHAGERSVGSFREMLRRARAYLELEEEIAQRAAADCRRQFAAGMAIGALDLAEARRLFRGMGAQSPEQLAKNSAALADLEVRTVVGEIDRFDSTAHAAIGKHFYLMWRSGLVPTTRNGARDFWGGLLAYLETQKSPNVPLYEAGLKELEARFGKERGYRDFLASKREALARLRALRSRSV